MKMLMNVRIPHEAFNAAIRDGSASEKLNEIMATIKPEVAYFTEHCGQRGAVLIVNMKDASQIPFFAEPWFLTFNADVEFRIAMTPADLKKGKLDEIGAKWA